MRLGRQPTGSLFAPHREWVHTDDEMPQVPHGPAPPPPEPAGASVGPDDTSVAGASPAEAGQADVNHSDAHSPLLTDPIGGILFLLNR